MYNTSLVAGPDGAFLAKHRKVGPRRLRSPAASKAHPGPWRAQVHLFDIDIPGKITFRESDTLTAGSRPRSGPRHPRC